MSQDLERKLRDTSDWLWLRRAVGEAVRHDPRLMLVGEKLERLWPLGTVPRQVEVAALEQKVRQLENKADLHWPGWW